MTVTPWLDLARGEVGNHEIAGPSDNPKIMAYYRDAGHPEIDHDEVPWCAAFVGAMLKRSGYPNTRSLAARSYCTYGVGLDKPEVGCIMVKRRNGNAWEGHVGFYVGDAGSNIKVLGGNQRDAVNVAEYPKSEVIAYRMPVAATVGALRQAGSTEIASADSAQKVSAAAAATTAVSAAAQPSAPPPSIIPQIPPEIGQATEYVSVAQQAHEGVRSIMELVSTYWWVGALLACGAAWLLCRWWKQNRVARAESGQPLSAQVEG